MPPLVRLLSPGRAPARGFAPAAGAGAAALLLGLALAASPRPAGALEAARAGVRLAPATPGAVRFTVAIPAPTWIPVDGSVERLELSGYEATGRPGEPAIPTRTVLVAVPPVGEVRLTSAASELVTKDGVTLEPLLGFDQDRKPIAVQRRPEAYGKPGIAAPPAARLLGVTWMRNQRVARVAIEPVAYQPALRRLTLAGRVDVELAVSSPGSLGPPAEPNDPFEAIYRATLVNPEQGRAWRRPTADAVRAAARRGGVPLAADAALAAPPDTSVYAGRTWIKIAIQRTGFYAVNFSRLKTLQLFEATDPAPFDSLRLFTWPGKTVLPENSYCDSCDYREVAIGIVRDVSDPVPPETQDGPPDGLFSSNKDAFYFFAQGPDGWANDYDPTSPDTSFINHTYERNNYYYLTVARAEDPADPRSHPVTSVFHPGPPLRIGTAPVGTRNVTPDGTEPVQATVAGRVHVEQDLEYWPDASAIGSTLAWEKWFWRSLGPGQQFFNLLDLPDADTTLAARFRLRQWGLTSNALLACEPGYDHLLQASVNGVDFPDVTWRGYWTGDRGAVTFDTTGVFLRRTLNRASVAVPFYTVPGCPAFVDRSGLAFYEYYYERKLMPVDDGLEFRTHPLTGRFRYDIGPFAEPASSYVFDVTDPLRPVLLEGGTRSEVNGEHFLAIADTQSVSHRYVVAPDEVIQDDSKVIPASAVSDAPATSLENLRSVTQGADYLVIFFDGFGAAAESLRVWRETRLPLMTGSAHVAKKVPISALYDQFSGGRTDPGAVRNFLRAASRWSRKPLYVTFLGDASFDFKDITGRAVPGQPGCLLPSFENNFDSQFQIRRQYATDDWMVNVDDPVEVVPDYLVGRIPAGDATSALDIVTRKIIAYERSAPFGEYRNEVLLFADDNAQGGSCLAPRCESCDPIGWEHVAQTNALNVGFTPAETDREYLYQHTFPTTPSGSLPEARAELFRDLNNGASLFNYIGHGSPFKMTDESTFLDSDAGTLTNGLKLPLLVAASCDIGKFNDPAVQSLGERLVTSTNGGCIAVISATELALSGLNTALNNLIYQGLFLRDTITVAGVPLPATGQYHLPISAALVAAKSVPSAQRTNSQKYQLMGDAATQLNLPRQWAEISLSDAQGAPLTEIARGQTVTFTGHVLDRPGGTPVPMDGVASVLIEDSAPTNLTPGGCQTTRPYRFSAGPLYHGDVTLAGGTFQGSFVVSMDATAGSEGRVRGYVNGQPAGGGTTDGVGSLKIGVVAGTPPAGDVTGPTITLGFVGGATNVRPDATLQINLFDESGIMTTAHAPQNSIVVTLDGNTTTRVDVTASFRYAADSHQSGTAVFQLPGLTPGAHEVRVQAADNLATGLDASLHRSSATLQFQVMETPPLRIERTYLFPNPVRSGSGGGGGGVFVVDAPGGSVNTLLRIYTVTGKLVRELKQFGGLGQVQIPWDGLDHETEPLAQGTYLYKVYVNAQEADGSSSARQKATAEGRFVVHTR